MNKTFNLLFYVKKSKINSVGKAPIYLRISIDGKKCEISTKRTIQPSKWNSNNKRPSGPLEEMKMLGFYLKTFEKKVYNNTKNYKVYTIESIKSLIWLDLIEDNKMFFYEDIEKIKRSCYSLLKN